jgi:hypothetical protein
VDRRGTHRTITIVVSQADLELGAEVEERITRIAESLKYTRVVVKMKVK